MIPGVFQIVISVPLAGDSVMAKIVDRLEYLLNI